MHDEIMTPEAVAESKRNCVPGETAGKCDGYKIPRVLYIGEHPVRHGGFYPDAQLRLIQNGKRESSAIEWCTSAFLSMAKPLVI